MAAFGDYIIYVDESGDTSLDSIDDNFPAFGLSFCIFEIEKYIQNVSPEIQKFKFNFWGHDSAILHEHEIRKQENDFNFLRSSPIIREEFFSSLNNLIESSEFTIYAAVIKKINLIKKYKTPFNPYNLSLRFCLERSLNFFLSRGQEGKTIYVIFESRGKKEDQELELVFRRMCDNEGSLKKCGDDFSKINFKIKFDSKKVNSAGLQLADLTARPIVLSYLRPEQENRALEIIKKKIPANGVKTFP